MAEKPSLEAAHAFLWTHARVLERRQFEHRFLGGPAEAVERAVDAYRNPDGGYGAALEPDCRTPHSQPEATRWALAALAAVGRLTAERARRAADWLASVFAPGGGVPFCLPSVEGYPKAPWWQPVDAGNLNPTARLVALLRPQAGEHPFVASAAAWCWEQIAGAAPVPESQYQAHAIAELLLTEPDSARAAPLLDALGQALGAGRIVPIDPGVPPPGPDTHTPLHFAPAPDHPLRRYFAAEVIDGFLERLAGAQGEDGGWPIDWPAPGSTAVSEWRAIKTLEALETLSAYGRL
jgi:hypothetical protein